MYLSVSTLAGIDQCKHHGSCCIMQHAATCCNKLYNITTLHIASCCSMMQHVAANCSIWQHVAACCSILQHIAACCSMR